MNDSRLELDNYIVFYSHGSLISVFDRMKSKKVCALDKARKGVRNRMSIEIYWGTWMIVLDILDWKKYLIELFL